MNTSAKIMVAYYKDEQLPNCNVWPSDIFEAWDVRFNLNSRLLEYDLLKKMQSEGIMSNNKYSGLMSHSAFDKLAMRPEYVRAQIQDGIDKDVDAILINPEIGCNAFFKNGIEQAQLIGQDKIEYIFKQLGFNEITKVNLPYYTFVMCTYIIAKESFWNKYFKIVDTLLGVAESAGRMNIEFANAYYGHANYRARVNNYDYRPFMIERIPQLMLSTSNYKIKYIESTKEVFAKKFGRMAKAIHAMYELKKKCYQSEEANKIWENTRKQFVTNQALLYRKVTIGEFWRTKQQEKLNLEYYKDDQLLNEPMRSST